MKIRLTSIGDLRDYFGHEQQEIELDSGATIQDLLLVIDDYWGTVLPPYLWDTREKRFRGPVFFLINKEVVQDMQTPLQNGLEVLIMRALVGG
jgi:sulfur carrier protein ThiS